MLTVRLPEELVGEIEHESRLRKVSVSEVVRERLRQAAPSPLKGAGALELIRDLIGSVDGLPADLSGRKKDYLRAWGYGKKRSHRQRLSGRAAQSQ